MIPLGVLASARVASGAWTPASLASLVGWWDASDASTFTYSSGVFVSQWRDKSGQARHLSQASTVKQPVRSGTVNGVTSVVFNGVARADCMSTGTLGAAPTKPSTVLLVARNTTASGQRNAVMAGTDGRLFRTTGDTIDAYQGSFLSTGASWGTTAAHAMVCVFNGASSKIAVDSGAWVTGNAGSGAFSTAGWTVGAIAGETSEYWQGDICEVIHVNATISDAEKTAWFTYATTKWGTP